MIVRPWRKTLVWGGLFMLVLLAFLRAGHFLNSPAEQPKQTDVVLALGGDMGDRIVVAARLYRQGLTRRVMLTGLENMPASTRLHYLNWRMMFVIDQGVPREAIILEAGAGNSWEEAVNTLALLRKNDWQRVMVVSDPPHMRRLHWIWSRVFAGSGKEFVLVDSNPAWWNADRWWESDESGPFVLMEYVKLVYYRFKY
jgi:uncharacterized SAM-binding protein YcdF (DUF218 family)